MIGMSLDFILEGGISLSQKYDDRGRPGLLPGTGVGMLEEGSGDLVNFSGTVEMNGMVTTYYENKHDYSDEPRVAP
jgi:hypothetical protein